VSSNGRQHPPRPCIELQAAPASREEAAAIAAAIEQFLCDTAPPRGRSGPQESSWLRAGLLAGVGLDPAGPSPWGDSQPWGSA